MVSNTDLAKALAKLVALAAQVHEESFDEESGEYVLSKEEAVEQVAPDMLAEPVLYLINSHWNESLDWAERIQSDH